jgi:predicted metal-dependent hydrolase
MESLQTKVGKLIVNRRKNQKKMILKYHAFGILECSTPYYFSNKKVVVFAEDNGPWIKKQEEKHVERFHQFLNKGKIVLQQNTIEFLKASDFNLKYDKQNSKFSLALPNFNPAKQPEIYKKLESLLDEIIKREAKMILPKLIKDSANLHGYQFNELRIKNIKTRWGSCSGRNNINLNAHLVRLPKHLIDYVILHELVHTVHKNHGPNFWNELNTKSQGKAYIFDAELKKFHTSIFD